MNEKHGFTLIELMVVIAIMGILGATAVPCYRTI
jgi:prepilin-type N-terminal cleavage/methylation domain-containing protein